MGSEFDVNGFCKPWAVIRGRNNNATRLRAILDNLTSERLGEKDAQGEGVKKAMISSLLINFKMTKQERHNVKIKTSVQGSNVVNMAHRAHHRTGDVVVFKNAAQPITHAHARFC